jgi:predicted nucleotidyltransferase
MKYGLKEENIARMQTVFSYFPEVEKAILYGSRAKGNFKPNSDIDITLTGDLLSLDLLNQIEWKLDDLLLPYKIDLSILQHLKNDEFIKQIQETGIVLFTKSQNKVVN